MTIEEERALAHREGVIDEADLPFLLEPAAAATAGVLLVHGFTASPWEMRLCGEALAQAGFVALGVRLPGHGTTPEDLGGRSCEEWLATVERGWRLLHGRGLRIYGVGQSTGALLLLALATSRPLAGLVLLSPYLRLRHRLAPLTGLLRFFRRFQRRKPAPPAHYYDRRPVAGIYQLDRLLRRVRRELPRVTAPTLVISAEGDRTIRLESADKILSDLGSPHKEYRRFGPEVPHVLVTPENPRWREVLALTVDFLQALEREAGTGR